MSNHRKRDSLFWGIILILGGVVFLLEKLDVQAWDYVWKFWPVILIVWGTSKLLAGLQEKQDKPAGDKPVPPPQA